MTDRKQLEGPLRPILDRSIKAAVDEAAGWTEETRAQKFLAHLSAELLEAARKATPAYATLIHSRPFLWDIFIGQYGTAEDGSNPVITRGLWAVESELFGGSQGKFDKLMVANVPNRLFVIPGGTRQVGGLQRQCNVANVACWVAELSPVADWRAGPGFTPWVKLQLLTPRR